jgi:hypothetical protein
MRVEKTGHRSYASSTSRYFARTFLEAIRLLFFNWKTATTQMKSNLETGPLPVGTSSALVEKSAMLSVIFEFADGSSSIVHPEICCLQDACERAFVLANALDEGRVVPCGRVRWVRILEYDRLKAAISVIGGFAQ